MLWFGLTNRGAEGNPAEQARVIIDRLAQRATRDGAQGAALIRSVLEKHLPR